MVQLSLKLTGNPVDRLSSTSVLGSRRGWLTSNFFWSGRYFDCTIYPSFVPLANDTDYFCPARNFVEAEVVSTFRLL